MEGTIHERRTLNEKIEMAYIDTTVSAANILTFGKTGRDTTPLALFSSFFSNFSLLVLLTHNLDPMQKLVDNDSESPDESRVTKAIGWIESTMKLPDDDEKILLLCKEGYTVFRNYGNALFDQGVIALPSR